MRVKYMTQLEIMANDYQIKALTKETGQQNLHNAYQAGFRRAREMAFDAIGKRIHLKALHPEAWRAYVRSREDIYELGESEVEDASG